MIGGGWVKGSGITVGMVARGFGARAHLFGHRFGHVFNNLHGDFVADFLGNGGTDFFGNFTRYVDGILDTNGFGKVFTGFSWYKDGKILALFLGNFFAFCTWDLFLDLNWNLKKIKKYNLEKKNR